MLGLGLSGELFPPGCQDPELYCTFLGKDSTSASRKTLKNVKPCTSLLPYNPDGSTTQVTGPSLGLVGQPIPPQAACSITPASGPSQLPGKASRRSHKRSPQRLPRVVHCGTFRAWQRAALESLNESLVAGCLQHEPAARPPCSELEGPHASGHSPTWTKHTQGPGPTG